MLTATHLKLSDKFNNLINSKYSFLFLALASFLPILPTIFLGIYKGVDLTQHVMFSTTFHDAILIGDFYPSWAANENIGFGGIGVRFYPPLVPFLFGLTRIIVKDWHTATWIVIFVFNFIGASGVFLLAKEFISCKLAILASIFFLLMPYHIYQIQNGSQFAEFAGCSVIPFSFLFITRICKGNNLLDVIGLAISFGSLILTHLPTAVIGSLCLLIYSLINIPKNNFLSKFIKLSIAVFLALMSSATYWIKVISEMSWLKNTQFDETHFFDYRYNFLLTAPWFEEKQLWFLNLIFLTIVITSIISSLIVVFHSKPELKRNLFGIIVILFFSLCMCIVISKPIWMIIPFLSEVQFPWRWLTITTSIGAIIFASSFYNLSNLSPFWKKPLKVICFLTIISLIIVYGLIWIGFQLNYIPVKDFDSWATEQSSKIADEWFLPTTAKKDAFEKKDKLISNNNRDFSIHLWQPYQRSFRISKGEASEIRLATFYYPHWKAMINNTFTETKFANDGTIVILIPAEEVNIKVWFEEPYFIEIAKWFSLITWVLFAVFCIGSFAKKYFTKPTLLQT